MILHAHELAGVPKETFHRHYNLMPWLHPEAFREMQELAERYRECMQPKPRGGGQVLWKAHLT